MKRLWIFALFFVVLASPLFAQRGQFAEPPGAELNKFPIMPGPLSVSDQARLGLSPKILDKSVRVLNHFRGLRDKQGRYILETLTAGTLVLVDKDEKLRYIVKCGNRISEKMKCKECPPVSIVTPTNPSQKPGAWSRFWDAMGRAWGDMWEAMGSFFGILIPLLLLGLLGYLIYKAIQNFGEPSATSVTTDPPPPRVKTQPMPMVSTRSTAIPAATPAPQPAPVINEGGEFVRTKDAPTTQPPIRPRFSVDLTDKSLFTKMNGFRNLRIDEDADGTVTIRADRQQ